MTRVDDRAGWNRTAAVAVGICFGLNMLDGVDILMMSYLAPAISADWSIGAAALGVVLSAAIFGMMLGALFLAPLADVFGRRPAIMSALMLMAGGMIACSAAQDVAQLIALRFVVGLGIGVMLASMSAITSEYAPPRYRSSSVTLLQASYPIGAAIAGLVTIWALPIFGWRAMMACSGVTSLIFIPFAALLMPESMEFLEKRQPPNALGRLNAIRERMGLPAVARLAPRAREGQNPIPKPFKGKWRPTLALWASFFSVYLTLYFVITWIPKLAVRAGLAAAEAILAGTIYNLGAFAGGVLLAWLVIRLPTDRLIAAAMVVGALMLIAFSTPAPVPLVLLLAFLIGVFVQGGFAGLYSLAAQTYPAEVRSTGIGWAIGIGRSGAVIGPILGGYLMAINSPPLTLFGIFAAPLVVTAALVMLVKAPSRQPQHGLPYAAGPQSGIQR